MQDERESFRRRQRVQHDEQREADRVREHRFLLGIAVAGDGHDRLGQAAHVLLVTRTARAQHVETHARDDGGQPAAEVGDGARVRAVEPEPRLLHGVLRFGHRAEHAVGDRVQV